MALVLDIQRKTFESNFDVRGMMFLAKAVAFKLRQRQQLKKFDQEICGFQGRITNYEYETRKKHTGSISLVKTLPIYRQIKIRVEENHEHGWVFVGYAKDKDGEYITHAVTDSILLLEDFVRSGQNKIIPQIELTSSAIDSSLSAAVEVRHVLYVSDFQKIIDTIRNYILIWALELEENGILGKEMGFSSKQIERASHININNLGNMAGIGFGNYHTIGTNQNVANTVNASKAKELLTEIVSLLENIKPKPIKLLEAQSAVADLQGALDTDNLDSPKLLPLLNKLQGAVADGGIPLIATSLVQFLQGLCMSEE